MRDNVMVWIGRLVAGVFLLGLMALAAAVVVLVRRAEGVPTMPVFVGLVGMVLLILLAGACLALISVAVSARRGVQALERLAARGGVMLPELAEDADVSEPPQPQPQIDAPVQGPFRDPGLREATLTAPVRPVRPAGRVLVAER